MAAKEKASKNLKEGATRAAKGAAVAGRATRHSLSVGGSKTMGALRGLEAKVEARAPQALHNLESLGARAKKARALASRARECVVCAHARASRPV